ncbi:MAG: FecR domain-containing protein [Lewinella sp.]|nr:FecR domain-containing protein [Lewinella sp.]
MENIHVEELIAAYLSGNLSARERDQLMAWVAEHPDHQTFFDKAVSLWSATEQYDAPDFSAGKSRSWTAIEARLDAADSGASPAPPEARIRTLRFRPWAVAAAATLLLAASLWIWMQQASGPTEVFLTTAAGERIEQRLPDGSQVWLNENSELTYTSSDTDRQLTLSGEAFFEVATDSLRPFTIKAGEALTTVLGTSFNLRAYPGEETVEVTVATGRVALTVSERKEATPIELTPGETGVVRRASEEVTTAEAPRANAAAWKSGQLRFEAIPLPEVTLELERYFGRTFTFSNDDLLGCKFYGSFDRPSLEEVLATLAFSLELEIDESGDTVLLSGTGCPD